MHEYPVEDGIMIVSRGDQPNYNLKENQWIACRVPWPKRQPDDRKPWFIILQWFIYIRNYGLVRHGGTLYNLNLREEADSLLLRLEAEGFLMRVKTGYTVLHPDYHWLGTLETHHLWVNLVNLYLPQLSDEEIEVYNREHNPQNWISNSQNTR